MSFHGWMWAALSPDQLALIAEAEQTLGADYLLVYVPDDGTTPDDEEPAAPPAWMHTARLNESQLECLQGLEAMVSATIVADDQTPAA